MALLMTRSIGRRASHTVLAKSCGTKQTSLPILLDGRRVIQGSGAIIDWADRQTQDQARRLTVADAREIEQRADSVIGVHVRRLVYAELLPRFPELAKPLTLWQSVGPAQTCSECDVAFEPAHDDAHA